MEVAYRYTYPINLTQFELKSIAIIISMYRPSNTKITQFNNELENLWETLKRESKIAFSMGDSNIDTFDDKNYGVHVCNFLKHNLWFYQTNK